MPNEIGFRVEARPQKYGDGRTFFEYRILFTKGKKVIGAERGPRRVSESKLDCKRAARERVAELKKHRLVHIPVTTKHISNGEARNCTTCAIAQALWHKQEYLGFPKHKFVFEVSTYGAWVDPRGIVLIDRSGASPDRSIVFEKLPLLVYEGTRKIYDDWMPEWTMQWDDWAEARWESAREYRQRTGEHDGKPSRPGPTSFVLDMDELKEVAEVEE